MNEAGHPTNWFLLAPQDNVVCPICIEVLKNPCQCCNGLNFCFSCITRAVEEVRKCPVCRCDLPPGQIASNTFARDIVNDLMVRCHVIDANDMVVNGTDICPWIGSLQSREAHISLCPFRHQFLCPYYVTGTGCLDTCAIRYTSNVEFRSHLLSYADCKTSQINQLTAENSALKVGNDLGFAIVHSPQNPDIPKSVYCGAVRPNTQIREGLGVTIVVGTNYSYSGRYVGNMKDGDGDLHSSQGTYNGKWQKDKRHGRCIMATFPDGLIYNGGFRDDLMHGMGKLWTNTSSLCYLGKFAAGKKHGQGKLVFACGLKTYTGEFVNDVIDGPGVLNDRSTNETLTGHFSEGGFCIENGVLRNSSGEVIYSGGFTRNMFEGKGVLNHANGSVYTGSFVGGLKEGLGKLIYNDNSSYEGSFLAGLLHGQGVLTYVNGETRNVHHAFGEDVVIDLSEEL